MESPVRISHPTKLNSQTVHVVATVREGFLSLSDIYDWFKALLIDATADTAITTPETLRAYILERLPTYCHVDSVEIE